MLAGLLQHYELAKKSLAMISSSSYFYGGLGKKLFSTIRTSVFWLTSTGMHGMKFII